MPQLQAIPCNRIDKIIAALDQDGACIALGVLPELLCEQMITDFAPHLANLDAGTDQLGYRDAFYGAQTKRLHGLFSKSPLMQTVLTHSTFDAVTQHRLIDSGIATGVRLSNAELMVLHENQQQQTFHRDAASWPRAQRLEPDDFLISANCALTAFSARNGATCVVPGSHRWQPERKATPDESCLAVMPQGSALLYAGKVIHAGGANQTPEPRIGLYLGFVASWLRPLENQLVTNDPEDIMSMPDKTRQLLDVSPEGFTAYA